MTIRRRDILRGSSAGLAALSLAQHATAKNDCTAAATQAATFVLVHGTWHGGWVWQDVANRLRAMGHRVYTPTCTGCGERLHLTGPDVGLDTHITDIARSSSLRTSTTSFWWVTPSPVSPLLAWRIAVANASTASYSSMRWCPARRMSGIRTPRPATFPTGGRPEHILSMATRWICGRTILSRCRFRTLIPRWPVG